jgi:hypothetical protein
MKQNAKMNLKRSVKEVKETMSEKPLSEEKKKEITKRLGLVLRMLERRHLYPLVHSTIDGCYVKISCVSPYYDGTLQWFQNHPKKEKDWSIMEEYAWLDHALVCPRPHECPTVQKLAVLL